MSNLASVDTLADAPQGYRGGPRRRRDTRRHRRESTKPPNPQAGRRDATPEATRETQSLASFLAPTYSSRQTRLRITGSGMRARTRRSCTVINLEPIIFAREIFTLSSPFASAHFTFCTIASHRTLT